MECIHRYIFAKKWELGNDYQADIASAHEANSHAKDAQAHYTARRRHLDAEDADDAHEHCGDHRVEPPHYIDDVARSLATEERACIDDGQELVRASRRHVVAESTSGDVAQRNEEPLIRRKTCRPS